MREQRAALIARIGEGPTRGSSRWCRVVGIALIAYGFARYRAAGMIDVWDPPRWLRHVNNLLLWPAFICIAAAYIPGDIKRVLKHPMLVGIKLWAFGHLLANGDLGSIILFGSFLAWAVYDRITLKRRTDPGAPDFGLGGARLRHAWRSSSGRCSIWRSASGSIPTSSACRRSRGEPCPRKTRSNG